MKSFCDVIKEWRLFFQLSQTAFGEKIGAEFKTVSNWETGKTIPGERRIKEVAKLLGIPYSEFWGGPHSQISQGSMIMIPCDLSSRFVTLAEKTGIGHDAILRAILSLYLELPSNVQAAIYAAWVDREAEMTKLDTPENPDQPER